MSPEEQKAYEDYLDLFLHPGWKNLIEDLEAFRAPIEDLRYTNTVEDLHANKGKLQVLDYIITLPDMIDNIFADQDETDEDL